MAISPRAALRARAGGPDPDFPERTDVSASRQTCSEALYTCDYPYAWPNSKSPGYRSGQRPASGRCRPAGPCYRQPSVWQPTGLGHCLLPARDPCRRCAGLPGRAPFGQQTRRGEGDRGHVAGRELTERIEYIKASVRAAVEHPFRVIKRQFGHVKARYCGLQKDGAQVQTLFP